MNLIIVAIYTIKVSSASYSKLKEEILIQRLNDEQLIFKKNNSNKKVLQIYDTTLYWF